MRHRVDQLRLYRVDRRIPCFNSFRSEGHPVVNRINFASLRLRNSPPWPPGMHRKVGNLFHQYFINFSALHLIWLSIHFLTTRKPCLRHYSLPEFVTMKNGADIIRCCQNRLLLPGVQVLNPDFHTAVVRSSAFEITRNRFLKPDPGYAHTSCKSQHNSNRQQNTRFHFSVVKKTCGYSLPEVIILRN